MSASPASALRMTLWACMLASTVKVAAGDFSLGLHVLLILAAAIASAVYGFLPDSSAGRLVRVWVGALIVHWVLTLLSSPCTDMLLKSAASVVLFASVLVAVRRLADSPVATLRRHDLKVILVVVIVSALLDKALGLTPGGADIVRVGGIYPEPSHLALAIAPVLVGLMRADEVSTRAWGWTGFLALTMLSVSATLFAVVTLCYVIALLADSVHRISATLVLRVAVVVAAMWLLVDYSPYGEEMAARVAGLFQLDISSNISSLVYLNGWETALANLQDTWGVGLGFNRMGCDPRPETLSGAVLDMLNVGDLNFNDGSFILSKLLSEMGLLGLVFWISATASLLRLVLVKSHRPLAHLASDVRAVVISGIAIVTLGALIRGTNYLSGSFVFGLFCLIFVQACRQRAAPAAAPVRALTASPPLDQHA